MLLLWNDKAPLNYFLSLLHHTAVIDQMWWVCLECWAIFSCGVLHSPSNCVGVVHLGCQEMLGGGKKGATCGEKVETGSAFGETHPDITLWWTIWQTAPQSAGNIAETGHHPGRVRGLWLTPICVLTWFILCSQLRHLVWHAVCCKISRISLCLFICLKESMRKTERLSDLENWWREGAPVVRKLRKGNKTFSQFHWGTKKHAHNLALIAAIPDLTWMRLRV